MEQRKQDEGGHAAAPRSDSGSDVQSIQRGLDLARGSSWLLPSCVPLHAVIARTATRVKNRRGVLSYSLDRAWKLKRRVPCALVLEFGVFKGGDITFLAKAASRKQGAAGAAARAADAAPAGYDGHMQPTVHGFDSFEGLPEVWHTPGLTSASGGMAYPKGAFDLGGELPAVPSTVALHKGWFEHTVPAFLDTHPGPVAFVHADADLYSSTRTFLRELCLRGRVVAGTVINFDEFWNYPGYESHECKAWDEAVDEFGIEFEYICFHGPSTEAANLPGFKPPARAACAAACQPSQGQDQGGVAVAVAGDGDGARGAAQFLSVSVIVTRVRGSTERRASNPNNG